jgi:hypothetical protein
MKVAFITTVRHNIGDDFVREGIRAALDSLFDYRAYLIHKHDPVVSCTRSLPEDEGPQLPDKILHADVIVQSGAPFYWNLGPNPGEKCSNEEWIQPLWYERIAHVADSTPVLNLAAGACQGYFGAAEEIAGDPECASFVRYAHRFSRLTTVRDRTALEVNRQLGLAASLLPCASIHAWRRNPCASVSRKGIALNFMPLGGHYEIDRRTAREQWARTFVRVDEILRASGEGVRLVAHDYAELAAMRDLLPGRTIFYSADYTDYFQFYAGCSGGIFNRVHGAVVLAASGVPAILVGNDSRARLVDEIGMPRYHVNEVQPEALVEHLFDRMAQRDYADWMAHHEAQTFRRLTAACARHVPERPRLAVAVS